MKQLRAFLSSEQPKSLEAACNARTDTCSMDILDSMTTLVISISNVSSSLFLNRNWFNAGNQNTKYPHRINIRAPTCHCKNLFLTTVYRHQANECTIYWDKAQLTFHYMKIDDLHVAHCRTLFLKISQKVRGNFLGSMKTHAGGTSPF